MLSLRHGIGNTSLVGTEFAGVPKAYRIPVAMPAFPALKSAPLDTLSPGNVAVVIRRADEADPDQAPGSQDDLLLQVHSDARYGHRFVCQSVCIRIAIIGHDIQI
jgi:hypothetical protein